MARSRGDDFDEDEFIPPSRAGTSTGRETRTPRLVVAVVCLAAVGLIAAFFLLRSQRAAQHAQAEAMMHEEYLRTVAAEQPARPRKPEVLIVPAATAPRGNPAENWPKALGAWKRTAAEPDDFPVEIVFRENFTARVSREEPHQTIVHETLVEVVEDRANRLNLKFHHEHGELSYSFRVRPDGGLVLDDGRAGLAFERGVRGTKPQARFETPRK